MSVWYAVIASISYMYMVSPWFECGNAMRVILAVLYFVTFIGGILCDSNRQDKIKKLESEIEKLKEKLYERT